MALTDRNLVLDHCVRSLPEAAIIAQLWRQAWASGIQDFRELARLFDVSEGAMAIRLLGLGLTPPRARLRAGKGSVG